MNKGFAIALAWPETLCKRAGAWYDYPMHLLGLSKQGYYKVGHAAVILVNSKTGNCFYYDFGRYHAPHGYGRVRSVKTDHDLEIKQKAIFSSDRTRIVNQKEILSELFHNASAHGTGVIHGATALIDFEKAMDFSKRLQSKTFIPYGPFVRQGTNCSRFVSSVIQAGKPTFQQKLKFVLPLTVSPTPMWNLSAIGGKFCYDADASSTETYGRIIIEHSSNMIRT